MQKYSLRRGIVHGRQICVIFRICLSVFCGHFIPNTIRIVSIEINPQDVYFIHFPTHEKDAIVENSFYFPNILAWGNEKEQHQPNNPQVFKTEINSEVNENHFLDSQTLKWRDLFQARLIVAELKWDIMEAKT